MSGEERNRRASDRRIALVLAHDPHAVPAEVIEQVVKADEPAEREAYASMLRHFRGLLEPALAFIEKASQAAGQARITDLLVEMRQVAGHTDTQIDWANALLVKQRGGAT